MNNKSTIIDEINVSECRYLFDNVKRNNVCSICYKSCKDLGIDYCYYKQLQRKTQECEKLKKNYRLSCLKCKYKNTKVENEQLKEDLTALQQTYEACEKEYKALNENYIKVLELSKKGIDSYEYCIRELEEENPKIKAKIKEISEKLDDALDPDETEAEESMDLLYEISEELEKLSSTSNDVVKKGA